MIIADARLSMALEEKELNYQPRGKKDSIETTYAKILWWNLNQRVANTEARAAQCEVTLYIGRDRDVKIKFTSKITSLIKFRNNENFNKNIFTLFRFQTIKSPVFWWIIWSRWTQNWKITKANRDPEESKGLINKTEKEYMNKCLFQIKDLL